MKVNFGCHASVLHLQPKFFSYLKILSGTQLDVLPAEVTAKSCEFYITHLLRCQGV
jgi:hypothetical protein